LRLSAAMLNSLVDKPIDRQVPIRDMVLGTPVTGVARITGVPQVRLEPSSDQARFNVVITGTVYSRTLGRSGPAVIQGHSITRFTATKQVVFEPGQGFRGLPPQINAQAQCFTDGIQSMRGGLIGRIVVRRASTEIAQHHSQLTAIAQDRAVRRIADAFERHMDERLARLNRAVEIRAMLANLRDEATSPAIQCCTTPHYLEIADAKDNGAAIVLPVLSAASEASAPVEIWLHGSLVPERIAEALKTMFTNPDQSAVLNALALLPGTFGKEAAAALQALVNENKVAIQKIGDWTVVELNTQPVNNVVAARTLRR
jgi:hypothetical protein